jgi:hypothetical protein
MAITASRAHGKAPPTQEAPAEYEQRQVAEQDHQADGETGVVVDDLRQAADAAIDQPGRDEEQADGQRLQDGPRRDQAIITRRGPGKMHRPRE